MEMLREVRNELSGAIGARNGVERVVQRSVRKF